MLNMMQKRWISNLGCLDLLQKIDRVLGSTLLFQELHPSAKGPCVVVVRLEGGLLSDALNSVQAFLRPIEPITGKFELSQTVKNADFVRAAMFATRKSFIKVVPRFIVVTEGLDAKSKAVPLRFSVPLGELPNGPYECQVTVLEKESAIARHQSSHNSGVLHCGLYYKPGSRRARLAVRGIRQMVEFCKAHDVRHEVCGKIVVATGPAGVAEATTSPEPGKGPGSSTPTSRLISPSQ